MNHKILEIIFLKKEKMRQIRRKRIILKIENKIWSNFKEDTKFVGSTGSYLRFCFLDLKANIERWSINFVQAEAYIYATLEEKLRTRTIICDACIH
jgi:hypothetical protein